MSPNERNRLFEERATIIDVVMAGNRRRIQKYHLCPDDIRQELAVKMLELLERYDPLLCPNLDAYLTIFLNHALRSLTRPGRRYGIPYAPGNGKFEIVSLDDDYYRTVAGENPYAVLEIWDEINSMPPEQKAAVLRLLRGGGLRCTNKVLRASRKRIHQRIGAPGTRYRFKKKEGDPYAKAAV